jgi:membrane associated rhomboid family serine protease
MSFIVLILIGVNLFISYKGLTNDLFFERNKFEVDKVLINKEYKRIITSGFLHVSWMHLIFNMFSLYFFSGIEYYIGSFGLLVVYLAGLIGGNGLSLLIHRHHGEYSAVGASGAVCGVIFASIALSQGFSIGFFLLPIAIPGWAYGLLFVFYSIYGIRSRSDNIGHEAHLGGALCGMTVGLLMRPEAFIKNYITILLIAVPAIAFIYIIVAAPHYLLVDNFFFKEHGGKYTIDHRYNMEKRFRQQEIDRILEKINKRGMNSLTKEEKQLLNDYSQKMQ